MILCPLREYLSPVLMHSDYQCSLLKYQAPEMTNTLDIQFSLALLSLSLFTVFSHRTFEISHLYLLYFVIFPRLSPKLCFGGHSFSLFLLLILFSSDQEIVFINSTYKSPIYTLIDIFCKETHFSITHG